MVYIIPKCDCSTCTGSQPAKPRPNGKMVLGGSICNCKCHTLKGKARKKFIADKEMFDSRMGPRPSPVINIKSVDNFPKKELANVYCKNCKYYEGAEWTSLNNCSAFFATETINAFEQIGLVDTFCSYAKDVNANNDCDCFEAKEPVWVNAIKWIVGK